MINIIYLDITLPVSSLIFCSNSL